MKRLISAIILIIPGLLYSANDFSTDANCVALYDFEDAWTDGKGNNDLTDVNTPQFSTTKKVGSKSGEFTSSAPPHQYVYCADASLDTGFPFKNGEDERKISGCFWIQWYGLSNYSGILLKGERSTKYSFMLYKTDTHLCRLNIGTGTGDTNADLCTFGTAFTTGVWYHVEFAYNGTTGAYVLRIWDDTAGNWLDTDESGTGATGMNIEDGPLILASFTTQANELKLQARCYLDEVVLFNDTLSTDEMNAIRGGTYTGPSSPAANSAFYRRRQ